MGAPLALDAPSLPDSSRGHAPNHDDTPFASPNASAPIPAPLVIVAPLDIRVPPAWDSPPLQLNPSDTEPDLFGTDSQLPASADDLDTPPRPYSATATSDSIPVAPTGPSPPIYIGKVPLAMNSHSFDKIAVAFHNSSRKTLSFVPPTMQNGEIIVRPLLDAIRDGSRRWTSTAVGYFLGRRPYFHHVKEYARSVWPMVREVTATSNGFFFFQFFTTAAMEDVIERGPWLFHVELWTNEGLSTVASGIGKPLYPDAITRACTRLDFACVCVMLDISSKLPKHIVIMVPREDGGESACKVDVEYEWLPPKCNACMSLGHPTKECPTTKLKPPPISVYVQKPPPPVPREQVRREPNNSKEASDGAVMLMYRRGALLLPIQMINATIWNVRGLNRRDHQVSVIDLVSEHRLQFIGLLEIRVAIGNVARVQRGMLPRWNWFVDYAGPGNRIWLAWDDDFIGVDVLETGDQFIHCSVLIRYLHMHVFITVVYGVNDVIGRRVLWAELHRLSLTVTNVPWLVGGDFNTMVDVSEVCGQSGDIRGAAEEFQGCLRDMGLITLPMQGEWFTWHNCSRDSRSLWKRLDRLLVNNWWLERWPNTFYVSLNARTSDHSPLVIRGDTPVQSISMFRFDNYLALSTEFIPSVRRIWQHRIVDTTMFAVTRKLKALKPVFRAQRQKKDDLSNNVNWQRVSWRRRSTC
ncbi:UNVERIFIED_CONTAM: hypothetical protein Slati_2209700 [Sesamum latifolium]|uniref:DUF4283 domain-containing protein n=1 Tax=Sesamum latifolium TaxID=2727402 RepID=A0AAW2WXP3_9LAMI